MKIESKQLTEILISDITPGDGEFGKLDPVSVVLKNYRPGVGEITIKCFQEVWTAGWGAMSGQSVQEFFVESDDAYLIGNLARGISDRRRVESPDWLEIYNQQIKENIPEDQQEELYQEAKILELLRDLDPEHNEEARSLLIKVSRMQDWWELWPEEDNPKYGYLKRVVQAVKAGLKQWMSEQTNSEPCATSS